MKKNQKGNQQFKKKILNNILDYNFTLDSAPENTNSNMNKFKRSHKFIFQKIIMQ